MVLKSPIRYCGGKSWLVKQLCAEIEEAAPKRYFEPFLGGGSIALNVPSHLPRILSDLNPVVVDMWRCLRDAPTALIDELARIEKQYGNGNEGYLNARSEMNGMILSLRERWVRRAAMFLFLNARCFNGLWRTNGKGYYNVPFGKLDNPSSIDLDEAKALSARLQSTVLFTHDYWDVLLRHQHALRGAAIYADPPYDATFTDYTKVGFAEVNQRELAERLQWCVSMGAKVWSTNSDTPLIREIYSWAQIGSLQEHHSVGATGERRGKRNCVLIRGGL